MKSWYPICLNPDTFESGFLIYNHDALKVEKYHGVFQGKWKWDVSKRCPIRVIVES